MCKRSCIAGVFEVQAKMRAHFPAVPLANLRLMSTLRSVYRSPSDGPHHSKVPIQQVVQRVYLKVKMPRKSGRRVSALLFRVSELRSQNNVSGCCSRPAH